PEANVGLLRLGVARLREWAVVERRTPTLIHSVVDTTASAIEELEIAAEPLAVGVLKRRQLDDALGHVLQVGADGEARVAQALLGRDNDDAVGGTASVL